MGKKRTVKKSNKAPAPKRGGLRIAGVDLVAALIHRVQAAAKEFVN